MKALEFVLAVPFIQGTMVSSSITRARLANDVCGAAPCLWTGADTPLIELGHAGVILGIVFDRITYRRVGRLASASRFADSHEKYARLLMHDYWGGYLAILHDEDTGHLTVMVDPTGQCPAFGIATLTHMIIASDPALLQQATGKPLRVSWPGLRSHLLRPDLRQSATCLSDVTELPPGELVTISDANQPSIRLWKPDAYMPPVISPTPENATQELRRLAVLVTGAWAGELGPVTVAASGGVDSSLICGALAKTGLPFSCTTLATADPSGDESGFVRMLCDHLGVETICAVYDSDRIDPLRAASAGLARPSRKLFMTALDAALLKASEQVGARTIFDGNGGDSLFCFLHSAAPILDRLRSKGPGRGVLTTFMDMCRLTGCDMPTMAKATIRRAIRRQGLGAWPEDRRLLSDVSCELPLAPITPWFESASGRHRGKQDHLAMIMRSQNYVHGLGASGLPRFSPLMSQPLVEYCLSIPTWMWCHGGINRALARNAFAAELPREILQRTSKAGPESFLHAIFASHRTVMRNLLMEGLLSRAGLLNLSEVDAALKSDTISGSAIVYRLLDLVEAENWARSWNS
jgi:asparagine synthase (glutamine-hydrolysing)